jgi:hypothetical protein
MARSRPGFDEFDLELPDPGRLAGIWQICLGTTKSRPIGWDPANLSKERLEMANLAEERPEVGWVLPNLVVENEVCWGHFHL